MREPVFIECRGCWRLVALGISARSDTEVVTGGDGEVRAIITNPLPSHDVETCPDCGAEYEFPPLDERPPSKYQTYEHEGVLFRFGKPSWPENAEENICLRPKNYSEPSSPW